MDVEEVRAESNQSHFKDRLNRLRSNLKWILLPILSYFAFDYLDELWQELKNIELKSTYVVQLVFFVLVIFLGQGGVSRTLVQNSDARIRLLEAIQLNVRAGFWGLLLPFGSLGYKAQALKLDYGISIKKYSFLFFISSLVSLWLTCLLFSLSVINVEAWPYATETGILGFLLVLFIPALSFMKIKGGDLQNAAYLELTLWHACGLLSYIGLYYFSFKSLGLDISLVILAAWVAIQSLMFIFPLVPGNLIIMEAIGAYLLSNQALNPESVVLVIALMRICNLLGLFVLAPWALLKGPKKV